MITWFSFRDVLYPPMYLVLIFLIALYTRNTNITIRSYYRYYIPGLAIKILGGIILCLVYTFYYGGGDTINYFLDSRCLAKLLWKFPSAFLTVLFGDYTHENLALFDYTSDWPTRYWGDEQTFFVVKIIGFFNWAGGQSYFVTTILFTWFFYSGVWKLYETFVNEFPSLERKLALAILFFPSVVFWGSGLLKDTVMLSCIGWYLYTFYRMAAWRYSDTFYSFFGHLCIIVIVCWLIYSIRPFILFPLAVASSFVVYSLQVRKIPNRIVRSMLAPILIALNLGFMSVLVSNMSQGFGEYSVDTVLDRAVVVQQDLRREYYGGNSFDIGDFEPTLIGVLGKAHLAINAALFRPYLWEAGNPMMLISGLENLFILILTLRIIGRARTRLLVLAGRHPLLIFSLVFSLFYAFSVGLTTANFGALVRYKVPALAFYLVTLFILQWYYEEDRRAREARE